MKGKGKMTCSLSSIKKNLIRFVISGALVFTSVSLFAFDNTNILVQEAVNHIYQRRYLQAHKALKEAYEQSPRHPGVHFNLGRLFELTGNYKEATKEYRLASALDSSMVSAKRGIARCLVEIKRAKVKKMQQTPRQQPESETRDPDTQIVRQEPEPDHKPVIVRQPAQPQIKNIKELKLPKLPDQPDRNKSSLENRTEQLLTDGKTDEALKLIKAQLKKSPDKASLHFLAGKALSIKGDLFDSIKHLEQAIRVNESYYDAYLLLGRNYAKVNLLEDAIKNYKLYYAVKPQARIALEIARIYESMGMLNESREFYSRANVMTPGNPNLQTKLNASTHSLGNELYLRANHAFTTEKYAEALNLFNQAIETGGLEDSYKRDALRKLEISRFKLEQIKKEQAPAKQGFAKTRKTFGTVNLLYPQLTDINFKTRFTGPVTVEWRGYIARKISRYGRDFLLMIKELTRDELDAMNRDRNDYRLNKHFNNQAVFLVAAKENGFPPFAKEGKMITFTGTTDWRTYNIINDLGQSVELPAFEFISAYPANR
ncbi:MAG: tetratricopeptide repeat protein [Candidatus Rifleibacteriota bacterium]